MSQIEYESIAMQINVAQLLREPVGASRAYQINEPVDSLATDRIKGQVYLTRTDRGILVTGDLSTTIYGTCARCLKDTSAGITFKLEDEYYSAIDMHSGYHIETESDDYTIADDHIIDLSEAIRQYVIMSTPVKMLCQPGCRGLCPVCGYDLSSGDCGHRDKQIDSRWEKLVQL